VLLGAKLDLVDFNIPYLGRIGIDHQAIQKQREEDAAEAEQAKQTAWTLSVRRYLSSFLTDEWAGSWDERYVGSFLPTGSGNATCGWTLHTDIAMKIGSYDPTLNTGQGEATSSFRYDPILASVASARTVAGSDREMRGCEQWVLESVPAQRGTLHYSVFLSSDRPWQLKARFIQIDCGSVCSDTVRSLVALPTRQLDYITEYNKPVRLVALPSVH
jgi:hypothetical protein